MFSVLALAVIFGAVHSHLADSALEGFEGGDGAAIVEQTIAAAIESVGRESGLRRRWP